MIDDVIFEVILCRCLSNLSWFFLCLLFSVLVERVLRSVDFLEVVGFVSVICSWFVDSGLCVGLGSLVDCVVFVWLVFLGWRLGVIRVLVIYNLVCCCWFFGFEYDFFLELDELIYL